MGYLKEEFSRRQFVESWLCLRSSLFAVPLMIGATVAMFAGPALAQSGNSDMKMAANQTFADKFLQQVVKGSEVHGRVGVYDFRRWHDTNQPYPGQPDTGDNFNTQGTTYGAQIDVVTGQIYGFSAGLELVYESSFYGNNDAGTKLNCNLACNGAVQNITQGFLQYNTVGAQVRAGRQLLNLPFAATDQFTFLPRSFNGVSATIKPLEIGQNPMFNRSASTAQGSGTGGPQGIKPPIATTQTLETNQYLPFSIADPQTSVPDWQIFGAKIWRYEGRGNADRFVKNNRYLNNVDGFWVLGSNIRSNTDIGEFIGQYYHYSFDQTEDMEFVEGGYMTPAIAADSPSGGIAPYIRAQYLHAYDGSSGNGNRVVEGIKADIYGLKIGFESKLVGLSAFANYSPKNKGSFNDGQMLHPYSDLSGVLYTDTMNNGIQEIGPGWAVGGRLDLNVNDNLTFYGRYVKYRAYQGHYHDFYFNAGDGAISNASFTGNEVDNQDSYAWGTGFEFDMGAITPALSGLILNDNIGVTHFDGAPTFYDNRIRFYYSF